MKNTLPMVARKSVLPILGALMCLLSAAQLSGCQPEPEIVRIVLVAPFEGRYREIGYDVIAGVKVICASFFVYLQTVTLFCF